MLHLFRARIIQCTLLAMLAAIDGYAQSKDDSGHGTLKFYPDPQSRTPHPVSGTFGAGLFHSSVPALTAPQVYSPAILNDSRGLDVNGNLPKGAESAPYRIRPMALAATLVTADLHEELLVLDGPSENGWSDSARFLVFGGAEGKGYFAPKATALPPGTYADMLRLLGKSLPSTIAFLKRMDSAYSLEIFPVGTLLCGSAECPAPAPIQSIPLVGVPTTVITGEFNLDRYPDIAVSIAGYPGRVQVLLGGPEGFSESSRKILTGIARFPIRNTGPQNRLGAARNIAVGLFPDTAGTTDSIPDLIIATCHPRIPDLGWRLEVFHNFAVEAAPRLEVLSWIEYEQQGFINLMFADADGDGLVDFLEMHPKLGSPLIEGPGGALEDLSITIWRSQKNGGFRDPLTLSASGQQPLGLTPIPFDSTRHSSPLFTAAFQKEVPASPTNPILPSGISLFQFNPLVPQSAIPKGALRGGPLQYLHQQPIVIDRGARVFYAILPEPDEPGVPGIGVLNLKAYLDFIAVSTSQRSGPVLHKGKQPARVGSAEFKRGKQTLDALGRVRSKAKAPRRQKPGA